MNEMDTAEQAQVCGIPIAWLHEIDRACDAFFARRGMKVFDLNLGERIHADAVTTMKRKKAEARK